MKKLKIGLDFDGVISDAGHLKSFGAKSLYGLDIEPEEFKKEYILGEELLNYHEYRYLQSVIYHTEVGLLNMIPVKGALEFISLLKDEGHEFVVITSRSNSSVDIAKRWCEKVNLDIKLVGVGYGLSKADACLSEKVDIFIDDDFDKLEPLVEVVPNLFLFSWGYNIHIETGDIAKRVYSWSDFYRKIQKISRS